MNSRTLISTLFWAFIGFVITLSFNNCSEQRFSTDRERVSSLLSQSGGIIINNGAEFTQSKDVTLTLVADGSSEMYLTNDPTCNSGGEWDELEDQRPWTLTKENASASVYVKFRNPAKIESSCMSDSIIHDNQGPIVEFIRTPESVTASARAQFSIDAKDLTSGIDQIECSGIDGTDFHPCSSLVAESVTTQGNRSFKARARDKAGNLSEIRTFSWLVDWTPPTVQWNQTPAPVTGNPEATLKFSASDDLSGIKDIVCLHPLSHQEMSCINGELKLSSLSDNSYNVKIKSVDKAGNSSEWKAYQWRVDLTAPTITLISTPKPFENRSQARFEFEGKDGNDPVTKFKCSVDSGAATECQSGIDLQVTEGSHHFEVVAIDEVGNASSPTPYNWLVDQHGPVLTWVSVPGQYSNDSNPRLTFNATDPGGSGVNKTECSINGAAIECSSGTIAPTGLNEGSYTVSVIAQDQAGNSSTPITHTWYVDRTPPTIQFVKTPAAITQLQLDHFEFIGNDAISSIAGYQCQLDLGAFASCTTPHELKNLTPGPHQFSVRAIDGAGNISQPITYNWKIDVIGPDIIVLERPTDHYYGLEDKIHFKVVDDYSTVTNVQCGFEGNLHPCTAEETLNLGILSLGPHKFIITAADNLGNSGIPVEITWNVQVELVAQTQTLSISSLSKAIDILFVVDNSGSMSTEQAEIKNRISGFISKLQNINWQIGVTSTDHDGVLSTFGNSKQVLTYQDSNPDDLLGDAVHMGANGSGTERGIYSTYRTIQRAVTFPTSSQAQLIRDKAAFATVLISDEDECSTGCSASVVPSSPQGLLDLVTNSYGVEKRFAFHSIIYIPGTNCPTGLSPGNTYKQLTDLTHGILGDVCAASYADQLASIGDSVIDLVTSVQLKCTPYDGNGDGKVDLNIYSVAADGTKIPFNVQANPYTVTDKLVKFTNALDVGNYQFNYNCLK